MTILQDLKSQLLSCLKCIWNVKMNLIQTRQIGSQHNYHIRTSDNFWTLRISDGATSGRTSRWLAAHASIVVPSIVESRFRGSLILRGCYSSAGRSVSLFWDVPVSVVSRVPVRMLCPVASYVERGSALRRCLLFPLLTLWNISNHPTIHFT